MSDNKNSKTFNQLSELKTILTTEDTFELEKEKYQESWKRNKSAYRKMVAKKNRRWLLENNKCELKQYMKFPDVYKKILSYFEEEKNRKYIIHVITNFFPLNRTQQVIMFREKNMKCPFTDYMLTDMQGLLVGNRDKYIAFSGANSNVFLSGIALQELNRLVLEYTYQFDTREGQIINFALDKLRSELTKKIK